MVPCVGVLLEPVSTVIPVVTAVSRNAETLVTGDSGKSPVSPVVVCPLEVGVDLTYKHDYILFARHHILYGRVTIVNLLQKAVA